MKRLDRIKKDIKSATKSLIGANNKKLDCIGNVTLTFTWGSKQSEQIFYICNDAKIARKTSYKDIRNCKSNYTINILL